MITTNTNTTEIITAIITTLFRNEEHRHQKGIDKIDRMNGRKGTFVHGSKTYIPTWVKASNIKMARNSLDQHIWPDMELLCKDMQAVVDDSRVYWQLLFSMINPCISLQQVRDTLPDFISEMLPGIAEISRIDAELHTVGDARVLRQFAKHRDKMEMYARVSKNPSIAKLISLYHFDES